MSQAIQAAIDHLRAAITTIDVRRTDLLAELAELDGHRADLLRIVGGAAPAAAPVRDVQEVPHGSLAAVKTPAVAVEAPPARVVAASAVRPPRPATLKAGKGGSAAARARETALLRLIAGGTHATSLLVSALPRTDGLTQLQHDSAVRNALSRLKRDGHLMAGPGGWILTAKGRKAAGAPAKEAP